MKYFSLDNLIIINNYYFISIIFINLMTCGFKVFIQHRLIGVWQGLSKNSTYKIKFCPSLIFVPHHKIQNVLLLFICIYIHHIILYHYYNKTNIYFLGYCMKSI